MTVEPNKKLTLSELLTAANRRYCENYLSEYFESATGGPRAGSGDSLAKFIVCELRETFDENATRERQLRLAVRALRRANRDIQNATAGLRDLDR